MFSFVLFSAVVFGKFVAKVWKTRQSKTAKLYNQPRQTLAVNISTHPSTLARLEKLALPRNDGPHNADVYCLGSTPRITTAARVPCLGFWGPSMSNKCDVAAFGWCWLTGHRRPARFASPGLDFVLIRRAGGQMMSILLYRRV
jgi:hypothetical protein